LTDFGFYLPREDDSYWVSAHLYVFVFKKSSKKSSKLFLTFAATKAAKPLFPGRCLESSLQKSP
jgi:hypothetical protein